MSIYGPPDPPFRGHAQRASVRLTRLVLGIIVLATLVYVGVLGLLAAECDSSERLEVDVAENIRGEHLRMGEATRLDSALLIPALPDELAVPIPPSAIEPPESPTDVSELERGDTDKRSPPPLEPPRPAKPSVPAADPEPAEPGRWQTAEILH